MSNVDSPPSDDSGENFEELLSAERSTLEVGYRSPLVARVSSARLTVEMLAVEIPKVRAGEESARLLSVPSANRSLRRVGELEESRREGERAKERLFAAALPLIRTVASKEWRRRQQWGSQVSLEDLVQEATLGFLKGIAAFKPEAVRRSATNYLGQWMLVEMRRSSEVMDHDLQVGHDAGERFRKIRALRSRLYNELGREPTDAEISAASTDPRYVTRPSMLGRAPTEEAPTPAIGKGVSETQVQEERDSRIRVGHTSRFDTLADEAPTGGAVVDPERLALRDPESSHSMNPEDHVTQQAADRVIAALVTKVIGELDMPEEQSLVVAMRYGLAPHDGEMSVREISRSTGIHRERVTKILNAFAGEITKPGGIFHREVSALSADDLHAVGLAWVIDALGPWRTGIRVAAVPKVLMERRLREAPEAKHAVRR